VARRLLVEGHDVRLLVRDPERARTTLGSDFEYVAGSVTDGETVDRAARATDGVQVSLGRRGPGAARAGRAWRDGGGRRCGSAARP
jgi:uncharacterized protein YbjT (DUF2867 family)